MNPTMEDVIAWAPFLAALTLAFASGFAFARLCESLAWGQSSEAKPGGQRRPIMQDRAERSGSHVD